MKGFFNILLFMLLAMVCWGVYGPLLHAAQGEMKGGLRPFICVGLAYFAVAVVVPIILLRTVGEKGHWTAGGVVWSAVSGASGAIGALCVILAMKNHGDPLYVMPLVFGGAPVVNSVLTIHFARAYKQVGPVFIAGLIVVIAGSVTVLLTGPRAAVGDAPTRTEFILVCVFTALTALAWGAYGPTLHKGQVAMAGSRLRPFLCVGLMYCLIAVLIPTLLLGVINEPNNWPVWGVGLGLIAGATGALGAMGIIMAFNLGGKPVYVMPIVFSGAPVVNTFVSLAHSGTVQQLPIFIAGLILTVAGAITVLVFAPRAHPPAPEAAPAAMPEHAATETAETSHEKKLPWEKRH